MNYLGGSLIIKRSNLFRFYRYSKILNFLSNLDNKFFESSLGIKIIFKSWWFSSFIFKQLSKREKEMRAFENSKILNYFLNNLINATRDSCFINKFFNK